MYPEKKRCTYLKNLFQLEIPKEPILSKIPLSINLNVIQ